MNSRAIAIRRCGLVTAVGMTADQSCAAFRAKLTNPCETRFEIARDAWLFAHQVDVGTPLRGIAKLARMAAMSIAEALSDVPVDQWAGLPLILCVAEADRPGRCAELDSDLLRRVEEELEAHFAAGSTIVAGGRVSVALAIAAARTMLVDSTVSGVVIAATDGLLSWPTLQHYQAAGRLLTEGNSDGFVPGEGAGALWIGRPSGTPGELLCTGVGLGREPASIDSGEPLRGDGISQAIRSALGEAGIDMHDIDCRIADSSGEQFYFKEAALAVSRTLRKPKHALDLWHPAECTGEMGAASGPSIVALAKSACEKRYVRGTNLLAHMANDDGARAALVLQHRAS